MQLENSPSFFEKLTGELKQLCQSGLSGTLFVTTEDSHSARFALRNGVIAGIVYRTKSGLDAIPLIKNIKGGSYSFSSTNVFLSASAANALPTTPEIFRLLGVAFDASSFPVTPIQTPTLTKPAAPSAPVPALRETAPAVPVSPVTKPVATTTPVMREMPPAKKILVVEDSAMTRKLVARILVDGGYAVLEAENGMAAFAQLSESSPDLMLLDIVMPGIDGYKVLSMIRKHENFKNMPVIMLTSRDGLLDKLRGKMSGSDDYLTKPFTGPQLLEKINKHLSSERR